MNARQLGKAQLENINHWLHNNLFFVCLAFVGVYFIQAHSLGRAFRNEEAFASGSCKSSNARAQDMLNFWYDMAAKSQDDGREANSASYHWASISKQIKTVGFIPASVRKDVAAVPGYWGYLRDSDYANAARIRLYLIAVENDYNRGCGEIGPTPQPPLKRNT
jgi:hypothetical protein